MGFDHQEKGLDALFYGILMGISWDLGIEKDNHNMTGWWFQTVFHFIYLMSSQPH